MVVLTAEERVVEGLLEEKKWDCAVKKGRAALRPLFSLLVGRRYDDIYKMLYRFKMILQEELPPLPDSIPEVLAKSGLLAQQQAIYQFLIDFGTLRGYVQQA